MDGHTELLFRNRISDITKIQSTNKFEIAFKTRSANGLLLFTGISSLNSYLFVGFIAGKIFYSFRLPNHKQNFSLKSVHRFDDNKWHILTIERNRRKVELVIDNIIKYNASFDETNYVGFGDLVTDGYIRVGGYRRLPFGINHLFHHGFNGCIAKLKLDDRLVNLIDFNLNQKYYPTFCGNF